MNSHLYFWIEQLLSGPCMILDQHIFHRAFLNLLNWLRIHIAVRHLLFVLSRDRPSAFQFCYMVVNCGSLTGSEIIMLERVHRKILRTIQELPLRCHSKALQFLMVFPVFSPSSSSDNLYSHILSPCCLLTHFLV